MNTADLIEQVAAEHGVAKEHAKKILDSALAAITAAASAGEEVTLAGFGRFKVTDRAERQGRNPATGETITIAASKKLAFTAAKSVRDTLNAGGRQPRQCRAIPAGRRARCLSTHSACSPNSKPICVVSASWKGSCGQSERRLQGPKAID
jgi:DNA-binding protein HU-beta